MEQAPLNTASTVLVVDDDEFSRDVITEMLRAQGVTNMLVADGGLSALRVLAGMKRPPDLMICDIFMPDMDGIEFMSALAKQPYTGSIVLISGSIETLSMARDLAVAEGIKLLGSFTKPLNQSALASVLKMSLVQCAVSAKDNP